MKDKKAGQTVDESDIKRIRPGHGLHPRYYQSVIGKTLLRDVERGDALTIDMVDL